VAPCFVGSAAIEAEIDRIRSLRLAQLRARWGPICGALPPLSLTKDLIGRIIAYRVQEEALGGLDRTTIKLLDQLGRGEKSGADFNRRLKAGTVLVREYQGERYSVTVTPDGFFWRDSTYKSLTTIARAITGTAWSGPRFFGLLAVGGGAADDKGVRSAAGVKHPPRSRQNVRPRQMLKSVSRSVDG